MLTARDLADRLNLKRHPRSWRGRCPACDYPGETFSLRELHGRTAIYCANGCSRDALADALSQVTNGAWKRPERSAAGDDPASRERKRAAKKAKALALWNGSAPALGTPADTYLSARGLPGLARSAALRFRPDTPHPEYPQLPAMIALVQDVNGAALAIHRTYLRPDGSSKADVTPEKASLASYFGGAIRLDPVAPELVVGEGIESAASAGRMLGLPAWAAIAANNLESGLVLPVEVRSVVIAADNDANGIGQKAARHAWMRWTAEGRRVRIATPEVAGDFNDVLRAREVARA